MMGNYHVRFGKGFSTNESLDLGLIFYFTMIIAVPTGIKIFSWFERSLSKAYMTSSNNENLLLDQNPNVNINHLINCALVPYGTQ
jgi:hypothetical protein